MRAEFAKISCLVREHDHKNYTPFFHKLYNIILGFLVIPLLQDIQNTLFQLDRALPHWSLNVSDCLIEQFPERLIGPDRLIRLIARS